MDGVEASQRVRGSGRSTRIPVSTFGWTRVTSQWSSLSTRSRRMFRARLPVRSGRPRKKKWLRSDAGAAHNQDIAADANRTRRTGGFAMGEDSFLRPKIDDDHPRRFVLFLLRVTVHSWNLICRGESHNSFDEMLTTLILLRKRNRPGKNLFRMRIASLSAMRQMFLAFRGSSPGWMYSRPSGPIAVTWVT